MWARSPFARLSRVFACWLAALWATGPARACEVTVTRGPGEAVLHYDPFASQTASATVSIAIRNPGTEPCPFDLALLDADRVAQRRLVFQPSGLALDVAAVPDTAAPLVDTGTGVWRGTAPAGAESIFRLLVTAVGDVVPPAGRLELPLGLELRAPGSAAPMGSAAPFTLAVESPPRAQLNIAGGTGFFGAAPSISTIDLGVLAPGLTRRLFLQIRSNVATSRLTISSAGRGFLMPPAAGSPSVGGIPYRVVVAGDAVDLANATQRDVQAPMSLAGASIPFDIVVGAFAGAAAGTYSDMLTIELSPI